MTLLKKGTRQGKAPSLASRFGSLKICVVDDGVFPLLPTEFIKEP
jgi:hypothetical protein